MVGFRGSLEDEHQVYGSRCGLYHLGQRSHWSLSWEQLRLEEESSLYAFM